jgi:streptogramin lyase
MCVLVEGRKFKMTGGKKVLRYSFVFIMLCASAVVALATIHASRAAGTVTATDYQVQSGLDPWGTTFDTAGNVWVAVPGCNPNPDCGSKTAPGKIEEFNPTSHTWTATYNLPSGYGQALFLAFDGSGNLWFPMFHTNMLGEMLSSNHSFQQWPLPTPSSGPWDLVFDHNGKIWISEHFVNKIAEFDPLSSQFINEVSTPAANSDPYGITVDSSNDIWFTENNSSVALIGEYTAGGQLQEYKIENTSNSNLTPHLITIDPSGNAWWSEGFNGAIGKLDITLAQPGTTNGVTEYSYPKPNGRSTHTSGISVDMNGLIWFDDSLQNTFGSYTPATGTFSMYNAPSSRSHPHDGLQVDTSNRIWFDEQYAEKLAVAVQS